MTGILTAIESEFQAWFAAGGGMLLLLGRALSQLRLRKRDVIRLTKQMLVVGYQTMPLAALIGLFVGMTLALNTGFALRDYGQAHLIPQIVAISLMRELGPVITAIIVTGRVGAAMAAEVGTMAVSEEVDVLRVLGIRIERFLVMPRIVASMLMTPLLTIYGVVLGLIGGAMVSANYFGLSVVMYRERTFQALDNEEIFKGLLKAVVFGILFSTVCCFKGLNTRGGAAGVGRATTSAVVVSLSSILIADYLLTRYLFS